MRPKHAHSILRKHFKKQKGLCRYCNEQMTLGGEDQPLKASIDHVVPQSRGGTWSPLNLVAVCQRCNGTKGNLTLLEYMKKKAQKQ